MKRIWAWIRRCAAWVWRNTRIDHIAGRVFGHPFNLGECPA
jgi:hypothetical protein